MFSDFKLYYKVVEIQTVWSWQKNISMEQNREPRNKPRLHGQFIYNRGGKNKEWGKMVSAINGCAGKTEQLRAKEGNLASYHRVTELSLDRGTHTVHLGHSLRKSHVLSWATRKPA